MKIFKIKISEIRKFLKPVQKMNRKTVTVDKLPIKANPMQLENWKNNFFLHWLYECHEDKQCDIRWLRTELMTCLDPEWATCIQDQVSNTKDLDELMKILLLKTFFFSNVHYK